LFFSSLNVASAGRTTRSESNESQLAQEFSLLASDLQDADAGVTMESGCLVEISFTGIGRPLYGVVRWCGKARTVSNSYNKSSQQLLVGVELVKTSSVFLFLCGLYINNNFKIYLFRRMK